MSEQVPSFHLRRSKQNADFVKITYLVNFQEREDHDEEVTLEVPTNKYVKIGYDQNDGSIIFKVIARPIADIWIDAAPATFPVESVSPTISNGSIVGLNWFRV